MGGDSGFAWASSWNRMRVSDSLDTKCQASTIPRWKSKVRKSSSRKALMASRYSPASGAWRTGTSMRSRMSGSVSSVSMSWALIAVPAKPASRSS